MGSHDHHPDHDDDHRSLILETLSLIRRLGAATNDWQRRPAGQGYTINQALVLHHLVSHGDATPSDLADWMHITRGSVTPTVKRLEDLGLLTRRIDPDDGRKQWLTATPEAHEIAPEVDENVLMPVLRELHDWPKEELTALASGLRRLLATPFFGGGVRP